LDKSYDVIVVGAGLAGLAAAAELGDRGKRVLIIDQEGEQSLGGQAFWSLGGLFMIDTPEQRRMRIKDGLELATLDWMGSAQFDRPEDHWPRRWAEAYLYFAAGEMRPWLSGMGMRWFPVVGWAERGGAFADGHGNSVPRFHITWGTGPGTLAPFIARVRAHEAAGRVTFAFRHRANAIETVNSAVSGVSGDVLAPSRVERGQASDREITGDFHFEAANVIVTTGGISVGEEDHVKPVLEALGADIHFSGVAIKPGKPVSFGRLGKSVWLGLPGNPLSAFVTWYVFGLPLLDVFSGRLRGTCKRRHVVTGKPICRKPGRCEIRPARIVGFDGQGREVVDFDDTVSSAHVARLPDTDGLLFIPAEAEHLPEGALIEFQPFHQT